MGRRPHGNILSKPRPCGGWPRYATEMGPAGKGVKAMSFGAVADQYERGRPGYPDEAIAWLCEAGGSKLIDLAAGTGKLTRQLADRGAVLALEPSMPMLVRVGRSKGVQRVCGVAEAIPVAAGWADVVTVAQAFHWFDVDRALPEIHRVLRPGGVMGLMWNLRDDSADWVRELSSVIGSKDAQVSGVADSERFGFDPSHGQVTASGLFSPFEHRVFRNQQTLDLEGLISLVQSRSNVVTLPEDRRRGISEWVERLWWDHPDLQGREPFTLPYKTHVFRATARA